MIGDFAPQLIGGIFGDDSSPSAIPATSGTQGGHFSGGLTINRTSIDWTALAVVGGVVLVGVAMMRPRRGRKKRAR